MGVISLSANYGNIRGSTYVLTLLRDPPPLFSAKVIRKRSILVQYVALDCGNEGCL